MTPRCPGSHGMPTNTIDCIAFRCSNLGDCDVIRTRPGSLVTAIVYGSDDTDTMIPGPSEPGLWGWVDDGSDSELGEITWRGEWRRLTAREIGALAAGELPWDVEIDPARASN